MSESQPPPDTAVEGGPAPSRPRTGRGTIRGRVARILALPAVVVLLLLGLLAAGEVNDYRVSRTTSSSVDLALALQDLTATLQTERGLSSAVLGGDASFADLLTPARRSVDAEIVAVKRKAAADPTPGMTGRVQAGLTPLNRLDAFRRSTDAGKVTNAQAFGYFTSAIASITRVDVNLNDADDPQLRRGVAKLQALQDLAEALSQERAFLNGVFSAGGFKTGEFIDFAAMRARKETAVQRFRQLAGPSENASLDFVLDTGGARIVTAFENRAAEAADGRHIVINPQTWWSGLTTVLGDLGQLQDHEASLIQVRAHDVRQAAALRLGGLVGLVLICFVGSGYLTLLASRSITRPLAELAREADQVATRTLPDAVHRLQQDAAAPTAPPPPVEVSGQATSEIRQVTRSLDRLQSAAYGLAVEQAVQRRDTVESLANLGRRNQNLIRRQLGFITGLEREEVDPTALANLFELDHLATRMRRNAASLLVLVDASSPRQWTQALPVADVIRAALSEVEDYRRVLLRRVDDGQLAGSAIGSVAHLLAELIENGLSYSPPETEVEVQGRRLPEGYLIAVTDQGMGMTAPQMREANARLQGGDDFVAAPTKYLGHHVVGKLARETGVIVELIPSPVTGVTARVLVPENLLHHPRQVGAGAPVASLPAPAASLSSTDSPPAGVTSLTGRRSLSAPDPRPVPPSRPVLPPAAPAAPPPAARVAPVMPSPMPASRPPAPPPATPPSIPIVSPSMPPSMPAALRPARSGEPGTAEPVSARARPVADPAATPGNGLARNELTRNGLRKRTPRVRPGEAGGGATKVIDLDAMSEYLVTPDNGIPVTAGFAALRDGMARGEGRPPEPGRGGDGHAGGDRPGDGAGRDGDGSAKPEGRP